MRMSSCEGELASNFTAHASLLLWVLMTLVLFLVPGADLTFLGSDDLFVKVTVLKTGVGGDTSPFEAILHGIAWLCIALSCIDTAEMILSDSASAGQSENLKIFLLSYLYMYNPSKILPIVRHTHWEFDQNSELDPLDPTLFFFQARQNFTLAMWQLTEVTSSTCWFLFLFKHRLVNHCLYLIGLWIQDHNILNKAEWHEEISSLVLQWASSFQKLPFRLEISSFMFLSWERGPDLTSRIFRFQDEVVENVRQGYTGRQVSAFWCATISSFGLAHLSNMIEILF